MQCSSTRTRDRKTVFKSKSSVSVHSFVEYRELEDASVPKVGMIVGIVTIHNKKAAKGKLKAKDVCGHPKNRRSVLLAILMYSF